jgi:hypothetical protein
MKRKKSLSESSLGAEKKLVDDVVLCAKYLAPHEDEEALRREVVLLLLKYELEALLGGPVEINFEVM